MSSLPRISVAAPRLDGKEREYVLECMDTTWISSVGVASAGCTTRIAKTAATKILRMRFPPPERFSLSRFGG